MFKLTSDDKFEIMDLIHLFFKYIDIGDEEKFSNLFKKDGTVKIPYRKKVCSDKESLKELCKNINENNPSTTHWESNIVIKVEEEENTFIVKNTSYWKGKVKN
jgi:hypothetical protein